MDSNEWTWVSVIFCASRIAWGVIKTDYKEIIIKKKEQGYIYKDGYLGSSIDEERSEMRYVVWIADVCESSKFWTQMAFPMLVR